MNEHLAQRFAYLVCFSIASIGVAGYFIGIQSPMQSQEPQVDTHTESSGTDRQTGVAAATDYDQMGNLTRSRNQTTVSSLKDLVPLKHDISEPLMITEQEKLAALKQRERNRAFNGAPPTIPHSIANMNHQACTSCHLEGRFTGSLRIPKMSHPYYQNCTQCHVESLQPFASSIDLSKDNQFQGLEAPTGGPRSFPAAPPQIPHSTWMRNNCLACHGDTGQKGIRTTHPWRTNCQQCHTASTTGDQLPWDAIPRFVEPLKIEKQNTPTNQRK